MECIPGRKASFLTGFATFPQRLPAHSSREVGGSPRFKSSKNPVQDALLSLYTVTRTMRSLQRLPCLSLCTLALLPPSLAHMMLSVPPPIHSEYDPYANYTDIDYSYTSPLADDGSNFPCKGYQRYTEPAVETYIAGHSYAVNISGSATHLGGTCQLSISYDNGTSFQVIKSMIGGCPLKSTYDFTIPSYAPSGTNVLFAWTWVNHEG
jgi:hypothetical protein